MLIFELFWDRRCSTPLRSSKWWFDIIFCQVSAIKFCVPFWQNLVFCWFENYRPRHTISDLVQVWNRRSCTFMKHTRYLKTIGKKGLWTQNGISCKIIKMYIQLYCTITQRFVMMWVSNVDDMSTVLLYFLPTYFNIFLAVSVISMAKCFTWAQTHLVFV